MERNRYSKSGKTVTGKTSKHTSYVLPIYHQLAEFLIVKCSVKRLKDVWAWLLCGQQLVI
jgi:hypothetical protein